MGIAPRKLKTPYPYHLIFHIYIPILLTMCLCIKLFEFEHNLTWNRREHKNIWQKLPQYNLFEETFTSYSSTYMSHKSSLKVAPYTGKRWIQRAPRRYNRQSRVFLADRTNKSR